MIADSRATRKSVRAVATVPARDGAGLNTRPLSDAGASSEERASSGPTPFSDLLTAMIEAHALEKQQVRQSANPTGHGGKVLAGNADGGSPASEMREAMRHLRQVAVSTAPLIADYRWSVLTRHLSACVAGFALAVAIGGVILVLQVRGRQPPVIAAASDPSNGRAPIAGVVDATNEPAQRPLQTSEPGGLATTGAAERAEDGIATGSIVVAPSHDQTVPAQPTETVASDAESQRPVAPEAPSSSEIAQPDTITPPPTVAPSPQSLPETASTQEPLAGEIKSTIDLTENTAAMRPARTIAPVRMRAGPSNGQGVVATIPGGAALQVVKCRHWCEVIFADQRGWIYKSFVDISPLPRRP